MNMSVTIYLFPPSVFQQADNIQIFSTAHNICADNRFNKYFQGVSSIEKHLKKESVLKFEKPFS